MSCFRHSLVLTAVLTPFAAGGVAWGQSSSLLVQTPQTRGPAAEASAEPGNAEAGDRYVLDGDTLRQRRAPSRLSPAIAQASFAAVPMPEPRSFALHDLITIIIRESTDTSFRASLDTDKSSSFRGEVSDFPRLTARDLLNLQLRPSQMQDGNPRLGVDFDSEFEGSGDYRRRESITGRITARVIDVRPNGTMVLEARKYIESDDETLELTLTGTARVEDVSVDNTILSTQLHDLHLTKHHDGELRNSTRKGVFTKLLDAIFNF